MNVNQKKIFLPVVAIFPSVVNETQTIGVLCLMSLCTTAPKIKQKKINNLSIKFNFYTIFK